MPVLIEKHQGHGICNTANIIVKEAINSRDRLSFIAMETDYKDREELDPALVFLAKLELYSKDQRGECDWKLLGPKKEDHYILKFSRTGWSKKHRKSSDKWKGNKFWLDDGVN